MHQTPLQTLLAERLQSARGLGWDMRHPSRHLPQEHIPAHVPCRSANPDPGAWMPSWFRLLAPVLRRFLRTT